MTFWNGINARVVELALIGLLDDPMYPAIGQCFNELGKAVDAPETIGIHEILDPPALDLLFVDPQTALTHLDAVSG